MARSDDEPAAQSAPRLGGTEPSDPTAARARVGRRRRSDPTVDAEAEAAADEIDDELGQMLAGADGQALDGRARRVPRRAAAPQGRVRQLPQAHGQGRGRDPRAGRGGPGGRAAARARRLRRRRRPRRAPTSGPSPRCCSRRCRSRASRPWSPRAQPFDPTAARGGAARAGRRRREPSSPRACAPATSGRVASCAPPWSRCDGADRRCQNRRAGRWRHSANGSRRTTTRRSASPRRRPPRRSPRPTASWPVSCIPTPTPATPGRGPVQGGLGRLRRGRRRGQAQGVRRGPPPGPDGRHGWSRWLRAAAASAPVRPAATATSTSPPPTSTTCSAASSVAVAGGGGGGAARGPGPQRGADLEAELHLGFLDAVNGRGDLGQPHVARRRARPATAAGPSPGTAPTTCPRCSGRGVLDDNQGFFSFSSPCPQCGGRGTLVTEPCPTCHGARRRAPAAARSRCASPPA